LVSPIRENLYINIVWQEYILLLYLRRR
jgi:hypothetical protein